MLLGCVFCFGFVVILNGTQSKDTVANNPIQSTTEETASTESREETSATESDVQLTQEPVPIATVVRESEESDSEQEHSSEETMAPTIVPTSAPSPKREETETVQNTPQSISPTTVPQVTQEPGPQSTPAPVTTKEPIVEEEVHVHEFEKAIWELPTCQKGGYYNNICKVCGFEESVTQEPLPHQVKDIIIQEGNCMEDRVIRHICSECDIQVRSDTRYPLYDLHQWTMEDVDGAMVECCERCGVVK